MPPPKERYSRPMGISFAAGWIAAFVCLFHAAARGADASPGPQRPWNKDVIYFALTDRFLDGDPENNVPAGSDPILYDKSQTNIGRYHGGDLRGLELALKSGYFKALGVTALWITPPVRNVWYSGSDLGGPKTGYHGYWTQDFLDIDPHLVSRKSLDGKREYPDTRDGRMQCYKDFVALAHSQGIKVIQDIVLHHAGPVFYYDANGNGQFDFDQKDEWIAPFKREGQYDDARWAEVPKWDMHRTAPDGPETILGYNVNTSGVLGEMETYERKGMNSDSLGKATGEEIESDFFSLRDLDTAPDSPNFDKLVNDFVEIYAFYAEKIGVDGFRIDTVKHVHHAFWDAFTERLRKRLGPERAKSLILFGEVYDGNPIKVGDYTYRGDSIADPKPCLDSLLDFPYCWAVRSYLRTDGKPYGDTHDLENAMLDLLPVPAGDARRPIYNSTPGADGLNSEQKIVNFIENHDGLNRFRVQGISERRNLLANGLLLTSPGIPCLYYGTEASLQDTLGRIGPDSESGRLTYIPAGDAAKLDAVRQSASFKTIAALCALRQKTPALTSSATSVLHGGDDAVDSANGVFAFARGGDGTEPVIVVFNASDKEQTVGGSGGGLKLVSTFGGPLFASGDKLERIPVAGFETPGDADGPVIVQGPVGAPQVQLRIGPETMSIYRKVR
jgi:alpha-amylase